MTAGSLTSGQLALRSYRLFETSVLIFAEN